MPYDLPDRLALARHADAAFNVLETDLMAERAASLGHHGRLAEASVAALHAFSGADEDRIAVRRKAVRHVWAYFVQREACGMRDHREIIKDWKIPGEVLSRLGAVER